jgi:hypothetical protein
MIRIALATVMTGLFAASALAQGPTCAVQAKDKKLAGAALASFVKKCEADGSKAACEKQSADKKLAGAAKASFEKKCISDAAAKAKKS